MLRHTSEIADRPPKPGSDKIVVLHTRVVTETGGGPDKTILLSAPFMAHTEYWLAAAYMHPPDDPGFDVIRQRAARWDSPLIGVDDRGPLDLSIPRAMLKICREYDVRIWHAHDYKSNLIGLMLRPFHRMRLVTTVHGWVKHTARTPLYYSVDRFSLRRYEHVIGVSEDLVARCRKMGVRDERLSFIPNGIDENTFRRRQPAAESELRRQQGVPPGRLLLGAMGRLSAEKGFDLLIRAVHTLVQEGQDLELWIAGEGDHRPALEKLIAELGAGQRIKLLGFCEDTIAVFNALDVFVLSSLREGLPNVVLEAMAMEVPVVATRVAGIPSLLTHGDTGLLCDCDDLTDLTVALRQMCGDAALRSQLAAAARKLIEEQYSFSRRMMREKAIYDRLLGREGAIVATSKQGAPV
ncbi:MAG: glycosyltransferase family 4 protein [Planctomycetes bacterium]|nr:glycosyltransferase family 4 protein [Planctomycetota bacterium]